MEVGHLWSTDGIVSHTEDAVFALGWDRKDFITGLFTLHFMFLVRVLGVDVHGSKLAYPQPSEAFTSLVPRASQVFTIRKSREPGSEARHSP